jgi:hypothetical protein
MGQRDGMKRKFVDIAVGGTDGIDVDMNVAETALIGIYM